MTSQSVILGAHVFDALWMELSDLLGTAATAALLRRSCGRAARKNPSIEPIEIRREGLAYTYQLPDAWRDPAHPRGLQTLKAIVVELCPLLTDLTDQVVIRRLRAAPLLAESGLFSEVPLK
ncbi:MAG: hypothetical protein ACKVVP_05050 [Chloroflexota bacterium]